MAAASCTNLAHLGLEQIADMFSCDARFFSQNLEDLYLPHNEQVGRDSLVEWFIVRRVGCQNHERRLKLRLGVVIWQEVIIGWEHLPDLWSVVKESMKFEELIGKGSLRTWIADGRLKSLPRNTLILPNYRPVLNMVLPM